MDTLGAIDLYEYSGNMHNHTPYSDGVLYHDDLAKAALSARLDFLIVTDHNVWVQGPEGYYTDAAGRQLLLMTGEEIHDIKLKPQGNHLLVFGDRSELATEASEPQQLIDSVAANGGLSFLAHPFERAAPIVEDATYSWRNWKVSGYTGMEIWNYMTEFKGLVTSRPMALFYAYNPEIGIRGPFPETIRKWDALLATGKRLVAIGNADAHGTTYSMGPLSRCIFPYEFLYRAVNTHVLCNQKFSGDSAIDEEIIYSALREGHCFVGYDQPHSTRGFRFIGYNGSQKVIMGAELPLNGNVHLKANAPRRCNLHLIRHGETVARAQNSTELSHTVTQPGAYRIEATIRFRTRQCSWIFSNPIYVRP